MASNLRDRLKRIQELKKIERPKEINSVETSALADNGWQPCGFQALKKEIYSNTEYELKENMPASLGIIIPDLAGRSFPKYEDFLFFDLETTGLSGGAGTVAFLAAFGQFITAGGFLKLRVTQYLLLDYPGENDFLEAVIKKIKTEKSVIVTYNGKCFDSQILKTRCLMNGIKPPEYYHADLLHPARRLWKNVVHDCSQSSVEAKILGIDRSGDIPGSLAPEIWFEFLKTGRTDRLLGICEHNCSDISGLACILTAMVSIAADPFDASFIYDIDRAALYWRNYNKRHENEDLQVTGGKLLRFAAESKCLYLPNKRAAVLRALIIDSERKLKDAVLAIKYAKMGLELKEAGQFWENEFERRVQRLERKLSAN
jgi:uncharacterized protein YprB with RNaseH-like and TPR domain